MAETKQLSTKEAVDDGELAPLSPAAVEAKQRMQKLVAEMEEAERSRRIAEEKDEDANKTRIKALNKLITVQEDLLRCINLKKVKEAEDTERAQRITEDKKRDVHDELIRKAQQKEVHKDEEKERERRIAEEKNVESEENKERMKTYDRLVFVQEDLLRHSRKMEADLAMKETQQISVTEANKCMMQEQLLHEAGRKQTNELSEEERKRQLVEQDCLSEAVLTERVAMASKLLQVHKEMLSTREPTKPIPDHHTDQVLEEYKIYMQEQLVRKAQQKKVLEAMDKEKERRIEECKSSQVTMSDDKAAVLEEMSRKASTKQADEMFEQTKQDYILNQKKSEAQASAIRVINQKKADKAMDNEKKERIKEMEGKPPAVIGEDLKKQIVNHN